MGLKDRLTGIMPDNLKPPLEPETFEGFTQMLAEQKAGRVTATPSRRQLNEDDGINSTQWRFNIVLESQGKLGRKIRHEVPLLEASTQDPEHINDWGGRMVGSNMQGLLEEAWILTAFITAEDLLKRISESLPGCETILMNNGNPFTPEEFEVLHEEARLGNIRPIA